MSIVVIALRVGGDDAGYIRVQIDVFGGESRFGEFVKSAHGDTGGTIEVPSSLVLEFRLMFVNSALPTQLATIEPRTRRSPL